MTSKSAATFTQISNAVLDLQAAELQTFERPLRNLVRLLNDPGFAELNSRLTAGLNLQKFLDESGKTGGSMVGSHRLVWPDDPIECLGLTLLLIQWLGEDRDRMIQFGFRYFYSGGKVLAGIHAITGQLIIPFIRDYKEYYLDSGRAMVQDGRPLSKKVFIVHGHDVEARETVARFIQTLGLTPIILHEQLNKGRTVIEKVEANNDVSFAVVLLTPDDLGKSKNDDALEPRARQNVLLELGYFFGLLSREHVCVLMRGKVGMPSDFAGMIWQDMDAAGHWKMILAKELKASGHSIDLNIVFGP